MKAGDSFNELINQGQRECIVIAVDGSNPAQYLYEYEMPHGTSAVRNEKGRPIPYDSISLKWLKLIEEQTGLVNLIAYPQQLGGNALGTRDRLITKLSVAISREK